ncbi:MAG: RNA polymerase sigma factor [Deltaproteobacteria bacterium]|nr:RNA polymerase sigma factor [Deltaproteobacteria bacterium]
MDKLDVDKQFRDDEGKIDVLKLYDAYYDCIFRYVLNRTGDVEVARDISADVFFKVHRSRWKFMFTGAPVTAWLYRIAGNEVITWQRKKKYRPVALERELQRLDILPLSLRGDLREEINDVQAKVNRNTAFHKVNKYVEKLPNKYQEVIVLRYLEEKSIKEIATLLGKKEGTIKSLISRGISHLRRSTRTEKDFFLQNGLLVEASPNEGVNLT